MRSIKYSCSISKAVKQALKRLVRVSHSTQYETRPGKAPEKPNCTIPVVHTLCGRQDDLAFFTSLKPWTPLTVYQTIALHHPLLSIITVRPLHFTMVTYPAYDMDNSRILCRSCCGPVVQHGHSMKTFKIIVKSTCIYSHYMLVYRQGKSVLTTRGRDPVKPFETLNHTK